MLRRHAAWVAALAVLVFLPVLGGGFVYDDDWTITQNVSLDRPFGNLVSVLASGRSLVERVPNATRPFTVLSFWFDRKLFGEAALGYHLHSLLLYAACAAFATLVAFQLTRKRTVALFAGTYFAVAPLHAEPVAAINFRSELYAGLGGLVALACLFSWRGSRRNQRKLGWFEAEGLGRALLVGALVAAGVFAKESGMAVVPLLALALLDERLRKLALARKRTLAAVAGALGLYLLWRVPLLAQGDDLPLAPDRGRWNQLLRFARFEVEAVRHALLPWDYNPDRFRQPDATIASLLTFAVLVSGVAVLLRVRATRIPALGVAIALAAPLPSSPLLRPINEFADRYFFLGVLGGGLFWGWCAVRLGMALGPGPLQRGFRWLRRTPLGLGVLCAPLILPTLRATRIWKDNRTLWSAAVVMNPASARAFLNLSREQRKAGEHAAASANLEHAILLVPSYLPALIARVFDEIVARDMESARKHVDELVALGVKDARINRAVRCVKLEADEARRCAEAR